MPLQAAAVISALSPSAGKDRKSWMTRPLRSRRTSRSWQMPKRSWMMVKKNLQKENRSWMTPEKN